jgi:hypothetical protein
MTQCTCNSCAAEEVGNVARFNREVKQFLHEVFRGLSDAGMQSCLLAPEDHVGIACVTCASSPTIWKLRLVCRALHDDSAPYAIALAFGSVDIGFGSKRGELSYRIIVRRAIKPYEEFCIRILSCN